MALLGLCAAAAAAGCGGSAVQSTTAETPPGKSAASSQASERRPGEPAVPLPKGPPSKTLVVRDLKRGNGREARPGDELTTRFVAFHVDGRRFESTWDPGRKPFAFRLGADQTSPGWERGLRNMRVGGRRELIVPPALSSRYGTPAESGPEGTLVYVIELVADHRSH